MKSIETHRFWLFLLALPGAVIAYFSLPQGPVFAQTVAGRQQKVDVKLLAEKAAVQPGQTITLALRQKITPGWHTYWINPGDSGEPTRIEWKLPQGVTAGPIQWPLPHAIPVGPLMNYGYSDEILLLSDLKVLDTVAAGRLDIAADVKWLVCQEICIPEEGQVSLSLPVIDKAISPRASADAPAIAEARKQIPEPTPWPAHFSKSGETLTLRVEQTAAKLPKDGKISFFPLEWGRINHAAPQKVTFDGGNLLIAMQQGDLGASDTAPALDGVLAVEAPGGERHGYSISATRSQASLAPAASGVESAAQGGGTPASGGALSLIVALGFAFLGGIILNLMPCVFPVLSLKALSFAKDAGDAEVRRVKGLVYLAGVLTSFAAIAGFVVALRAGGSTVGWGMQFQSPVFVLAMMALFLALGLSLSGVFTIGAGITNIGDSLTRRAGLPSYFFTGVLATVVATPCTAPFMGAAIGYAFSQPAVEVFAILIALGLGFALPMLLLSLTPGLERFLPRPGAWMETFKQLMAFPLYVTVGWLLWVLSIQEGSDGVLAAIVTLIGVAFAAWLLGRRSDAGWVRDGVAAAIAVLAVGLGAWSLGAAGPRESSKAAVAADRGGLKSEAFTQARLDALTAEHKPVFVNLTAAWCITCKVNERVALSSSEVAEAFADRGVAYLVGDWTNGNPEITALLKTHGRVGVPLYLLYSGVPGAEPEILPQLLTESMILGRLAAISSPSKQANGGL
jgi:thiol:disulfide interchange protein DsbD